MTADDPLLAVALDAFREAYVAGCPFLQDRDLAEALSVEASPVLEALAEGLGRELGRDRSGEGAGDPERNEHHEALAMVTLLGRRAGALGVTPTAALAISSAMVAGLRRIERPVSTELSQALAILSVEGYVAGREDALRDSHAANAIETAAIITVVPRVLALVLSGEHDSDAIAEIVDRFGRRLLKVDAVAAIVDLSLLGEASDERAVEVFGAHATARMLGVTCFFVGAAEPWREAATRKRIDLDLVRFEPSFEAALRASLSLASLKLESTSWLPGPLKRVLRK